MSFFKSALDFVAGSNSDHELIGSYVELGSQKLYVNKVIAEGKQRSTRWLCLLVGCRLLVSLIIPPNL